MTASTRTGLGRFRAAYGCERSVTDRHLILHSDRSNLDDLHVGSPLHDWRRWLSVTMTRVRLGSRRRKHEACNHQGHSHQQAR